MDDRVRDFVAECEELVNDCRRFCYAARAREFQVDAIARLKGLKEKASALKAEMVALEDEDSANCLLSLGEILKAFTNELQMWVDLKDDDPNAAWGALVEAQTAARTAMQAHEVADHMENHIQRLEILETVLFPPQTFLSIGFIIKRSSCSICGQEYGDCNHLAGKAYMGEMCARIIKEVDLLETSIVKEPANRHCRVLSFSDSGVMRDVMTWRVIPDSSPFERPE